ncbi:MAG: aconitase X swivel domain-containing protein [Actinomycetota bacterium]
MPEPASGAASRVLVPGVASGEVLVLDEPLSFWGGLDPDTGRLIDTHHPQVGASLAGRVLVMPSGRGSSSSSYVFAEAIRAGTAPVAVVLAEADAIVALGAIVAGELYGVEVPVVTSTDPALVTGSSVTVRATADGYVDISPA